MAHRVSPVAAKKHHLTIDSVSEMKRSREKVNDDLTPPAGKGHGQGRGRDEDESTKRDSFLDSIIRSKVQPSPVRAQTLTRDRLLDWLTHHMPERLKLITAEAGYGKTTLLADFSSRGLVPCLWYKLETSDRDWVTFLNYLVAAGRQLSPGFAPATAGLLRQMAAIGATRDVIVGSLISELSQLGDDPVLLILDDFHLVDESEDVQAIIGRLLEHAPTAFTLLISSRRAPDLRLGRLRAQGEVSRLSTDDLRFLPAETRDLFATTYGQPLAPDLLREVDTRTEGWGASLQLLYSSIRARRPDEVHDFVYSLSGAEGSLYDFLAEEVLGHLSPELQSFVIETSILQRIVPSFAAAVLTRDATQVPIPRILARIDEAEEMGLLGRSSTTSISRRFHPLLREFLQRRFEASTSPLERRQTHLRVARAAESADWLTACHHLIEAGEHVEAMRVLSESATQALGTGSLGAAMQLLPRIPDVPPAPSVLAMQARSLAVTDPARALAMLSAIDLDAVPSSARALIRQIRTYAHFRSGDREAMVGALDELIDDATTPESLRQIATAQLMMLKASSGRISMRRAIDSLASLADRQVANGEHYFAAISYHNALVCALAQGDHERGVILGQLALREFGATPGYRFEAQSTHAGLYVARMELGDTVGAGLELEAILADDQDADADAFADVASVLAIIGDADGAMRLFNRARQRLAEGWTDLSATTSLVWAEALILLTTGQAPAALSVLETLSDTKAYTPEHASVQALRIAVASMAADHSEAAHRTARALEVSKSQGAWALEARASILTASIEERSTELRNAVRDGARKGVLVLLEMADVLGCSLYLLDPVPEELIDSIAAWPARWLPVLRRTLEGSHKANAMASARLLARFGTQADAPRLAAYDKTNRKHLRGTRYARILAERVSDHLYIRDLGRVEYRIGDRVVPLSETRRKAAAVIAYLVARPNQTATREQVLDDLWPEADPQAAANSLHQTLYFLRRDIDPWYDDESSASYVLYEGEMLWLSRTLVFPESAAFDVAAASANLPTATLESQLEVLMMYRGRFAPDFEYEEWSLAWRDRLHASYLALTKAAFKRLVREGRLDEAIHVCQVALALDPDALDIEQALTWAYCQAGSDSAASRQYAHFARAHLAEFGVDPPSLTSVRAFRLDEL